jgi:membrane protein
MSEKLNFKTKFIVIKNTIIGFFQENSFMHCAALSYYTVLTLIPTIYLSFVTFGQIIGQKTMVEIIGKFLKENVGIEDIKGILSFLDTVDFEKGNIVMEYIGLFFLLISVSALFNTLKFSINDFFDIEKTYTSKKKKIISDLKSRLTSVIILTFFGVILITTYFAQIFLTSFGTMIFKDLDFFQHLLFVIIQHGVAISSNLLIFLLIFKFLNDAKVSWKLAWKGSLFTSVLLYIGQLLIKFYLTNYFFAKDAGLAGSILIILVWMYYSSHIIFLGAKYIAVYAKQIGKPLIID